MMGNNKEAWRIHGLLFLGALCMRLAWSLLYSFDGLYGQDAYAYFNGAENLMAHGAFFIQTAGMPAPFYVQTTPGLSLWMALLFSIFGSHAWLGMAISLITGALAVNLTYAISQRFLSNDWALIPAGLIAAAPAAVMSSLMIMTDGPGMCLLAASILMLLRYLEEPSTKRWLLLAFVTGLAVLIRLPAGLVVLPILAGLLIHRRFPSPALVLAGICVGGLTLLPEWLYLLYKEEGVFSFHMIARWSPLNAFQTEFTTQDGHLSYPWPLGLEITAMAAGHKFLTPVAALLAPLGLWQIRKDKSALGIVGLWFASYFIFALGLTVMNPRYLLPLLIPYAILATLGLRALAPTLEKRKIAGVLLLAGILTTQVWGQARQLQPFLELKEDELALATWVQENTKESDQVVSLKMAFAIDHYAGRSAVEIFFFSPQVHLEKDQPIYMIWDPEDMKVRAGNPRINENHEWIKAHCQQEPVHQHGPYSVWRATCAPPEESKEP